MDHDGRGTSRVHLLQLVRRSLKGLLLGKQGTGIRAIEVRAPWRTVDNCIFHSVFGERYLSSRKGHRYIRDASKVL